MLGLHYKTRARFRANALGLTIMEIPAAMGIMFLGFFFPLLCLILMVMRFTLFLEAARESADSACQAQSFSAIPGGNGNSALGSMSLAQTAAINVASMFGGVTINPDDVKCSIIVTPFNSAAPPTVVTGPLTTPVDDSANLYQLRVDVAGQIQPIFTLPSGIFGDIPGLTGPYPVQTSAVRVFANPQGLYTANSGGGNGGNPTGAPPL